MVLTMCEFVGIAMTFGWCIWFIMRMAILLAAEVWGFDDVFLVG